jgi:prepilin-type N-terminal cleavage/methylation domain-containing protein
MRTDMKKYEKGFSAVEVLLVVVILGILGVLGYVAYQAHQKVPVSTQSTQAHSAATSGTTQSINTLTAQDITSESSIDTKHSTKDQSTVQGANGAAANIGGSYDESTL